MTQKRRACDTFFGQIKYNVGAAIGLLTFVASVAFWVFTMDGIPKRVLDLEAHAATSKENDIEAKTRIDDMFRSVTNTENRVNRIYEILITRK